MIMTVPDAANGQGCDRFFRSILAMDRGLTGKFKARSFLDQKLLFAPLKACHRFFRVLVRMPVGSHIVQA